jgi:hypothetical protein
VQAASFCSAFSLAASRLRNALRSFAFGWVLKYDFLRAAIPFLNRSSAFCRCVFCAREHVAATTVGLTLRSCSSALNGLAPIPACADAAPSSARTQTTPIADALLSGLPSAFIDEKC